MPLKWNPSTKADIAKIEKFKKFYLKCFNEMKSDRAYYRIQNYPCCTHLNPEHYFERSNK